MCGICGIVEKPGRQADEQQIRRMMQKIRHRGPDDEGVFLHENTGFGFLRLSILDLSPAGHQPMKSRDGRYTLIFNGEIFNYLELREELRTKGHRFVTETDTEVLLAAYREWGRRCLHRFNGMWAFAIHDRESKTLFAARDRYGIKPFYYTADENRFLFASEIPSILEVLEHRPDPNRPMIYDYLVYNRTDHTEETFFSGIKKLPHGHTLSLDLKQPPRPVVEKWYDLRSEVEKTAELESPEEFRELFESSVHLRLRSDVPVGVCLSGGLDSSAIVSTILKSGRNEALNTFSAVYGKGVRGDETSFINEYRGQVSNMHDTRPTGENLLADMETFVTAHAEPIPSTSPYAQYCVMKLAKEHVTVTLDGQGADELLAGYHYFFGYYFKDLLRSVRLGTFVKEAGTYLANHRSLYGLKTLAYILLPRKLRETARSNRRGYLHPDFTKAESGSGVIERELYGSAMLYDALLNHFEYKLEHLLKWEDRNSMHHSLEGRVPFLDHRLVEKTLALKGRNLIENGTTKHIFREAMKGVLPEKIRTRQDKIGFATPEDRWFREEYFQSEIRGILNGGSLGERQIIDPRKAEDLYAKHVEGRINISQDIWKWINLNIWHNKFFL